MRRHWEILTSNSYWNKRLNARMLSKMNYSRASLSGLKKQSRYFNLRSMSSI
jgi:hypothetical protein